MRFFQIISSKSTFVLATPTSDDRRTFFAPLFLEEMLKNRNFLFFVRRLAVTLRPVHRSASIQSSDRLGAQMKELNDGKRFKESLSLFDSREPSKATDLSINQALKASIHSGDFQRGLAIHKALSSRSLKCRHIQMSLVQLYSESFSSERRNCRCLLLVRIGDVSGAQRVFSSVPINQRTPFLYTAMLNGNCFSFALEISLLVQVSSGISDWKRHWLYARK